MAIKSAVVLTEFSYITQSPIKGGGVANDHYKGILNIERYGYYAITNKSRGCCKLSYYKGILNIEWYGYSKFL